MRQIKPSKCSGGRHKVAPDTDPPPPRAADKKAAVDTSQGGLFRSGRETLFLIDGFRLHRLTDDPARLGGPTIQRAALVQHVLALGMVVMLLTAGKGLPFASLVGW